jgi:phage-related protein
MATFTAAPDFGATVSEKPRLVEARFGDGYTQRAGDGINVIAQSWSLRFSGRTATEYAAILSFLRAQSGYTAFDWTAPDGTVGIWVCREWTYTPDTAAANTVTATFERVFGE